MLENENNLITYNTASAIILDPLNRILLQRKDSAYVLGPGKWCLWGGHIKEGERAEETVKREIEEELGIKIDKLLFFGEFPYEQILGDKKIKLHQKIFIIRFNGDLKKISLREGAGFSLFEASELQRLDIFPANKEIINKYFNREP